MKLTIQAHNLSFTYNNICKIHRLFWVDNINTYKNKKVWLTIQANLGNNTSLTLMNNLPFNTLDYEDTLIVLENKFKSNCYMYSRADTLNFITFTYHVKNNNTNPKWDNINYLVLACLSGMAYYFIIFYCCVWIPSGDEPVCIVDTSTFVFKDKPKIHLFNIFIELFNVKSTYYTHYPSYFVPNTGITQTLKPEFLSILDKVNHEQFSTINDLVTITCDSMGELKKILAEYASIPTNY